MTEKELYDRVNGVSRVMALELTKRLADLTEPSPLLCVKFMSG